MYLDYLQNFLLAKARAKFCRQMLCDQIQNIFYEMGGPSKNAKVSIYASPSKNLPKNGIINRTKYASSLRDTVAVSQSSLFFEQN